MAWLGPQIQASSIPKFLVFLPILVKKRWPEEGGCREYVKVHLPELSGWQNGSHNSFYETEILSEAAVAQEFSGMGTDTQWHTWEMKILIANIGSHTLCQYVLERSLPLRTTVSTRSCCSFWRAFSGYLPFEPLAKQLTQNAALQRLVSERPRQSQKELFPGWQLLGPNAWWNLGPNSHQVMPLFKT